MSLELTIKRLQVQRELLQQEVKWPDATGYDDHGRGEGGTAQSKLSKVPGASSATIAHPSNMKPIKVVKSKAEAHREASAMRRAGRQVFVIGAANQASFGVSGLSGKEYLIHE